MTVPLWETADFNDGGSLVCSKAAALRDEHTTIFIPSSSHNSTVNPLVTHDFRLIEQPRREPWNPSRHTPNSRQRKDVDAVIKSLT